MNNKDFFKITIKTIHLINNDAQTGDVQNIVVDILKRYGFDLTTIETYKEEIDYKSIFLNIYYTTGRISQAPFEFDPDYKRKQDYGISLIYMEDVMRAANIFNEYVIRNITEEEFLEVRKKYNLK